mmetsp:Transcript_17106/g.29591  ORF Transcript_17106/g.29591 Transcript_17106/m.29591 type:complete len:208 (+) Transcript_17106:84-707(+)|eukprot:CAMPEP_0196659294 /NCGR_PEP_ID=MMETSP1086-20130531/34231_1 /TAXON_ID=77921 /ORGANISM="Cyanoptyche  gloeocystis , Strain SAG4.97" /LENGTH=207 /DNA_ID=CAMNT_0041993211 /DNA_START=84 /DNA_END=707 /DNA_ORIENTATION=-
MGTCFASLCGGSPSASTSYEDVVWSLAAPDHVEPESEVVISWKVPQNYGIAWIGIYKQGQEDDTKAIQWNYINDANGSLVFPFKGLEDNAEYEARIFQGEEYDKKKAISNSFVVGSWTISVDQRIEKSKPVYAYYTAPSNFRAGWIGLFRASAKDSEALDYVNIDKPSGYVSFSTEKLVTDFAYEARIFHGSGFECKKKSSFFTLVS